MPRTVVFDFYGTLARSVSEVEHPRDFIARYGYELDRHAVERTVWAEDGVEHAEASQSREHYEQWRRDKLLAFLAESDVHPAEAEVIATEMRAQISLRHLEAYDEVPDVLRALRERGAQLVVCSNWDWDLVEALDAVGLADAFDVVVSSAWVGARKPHPRIYARTLGQAGTGATGTLFVGDTWVPDVEGPLAAGLRPVYLDREGSWPDPSAPADPGAVGAELGVTVARDLRVLLDLVRSD